MSDLLKKGQKLANQAGGGGGGHKGLSGGGLGGIAGGGGHGKPGHGGHGKPGHAGGGNTSAHKAVDKATDKVGMGDKYDSKINKVVDGQMHKK